MSGARVYSVGATKKIQPNRIYHGDSLEGMKKIESESIDLVITSPPYADMKVYADGFAGFLHASTLKL